MRYHAIACALGAVLLIGQAWAQEPAPSTAEPETPSAAATEPALGAAADPLVSLRAFWLALSAGDAEAFRSAVDLTLMLQDVNEDGTVGGRYTVSEQSWSAWRAAFPAAPRPGPILTVDEAQVTLLGSQLCQITYRLGEPGGGTSRQCAVLVLAGHWRVVFATLPGAAAPLGPPSPARPAAAAP